MRIETIIVIIIGIILLLQRECANKARLRAWESVNTSITKEIDRAGHEVTSLKTVTASRKAAIKMLKASNDSLNLELAKALKKAGRKAKSVTNFGGSTGISKRDTTIIVKTDTLILEGDSLECDTIVLYPVYFASHKSKWIDYRITASKDSVLLFANIHNEYEVTHKEISRGYKVFITNKNPNTTTNDVRAFFIKDKPNKIGLGISAGLGFSRQGELTPYIGIGLNYNIINL